MTKRATITALAALLLTGTSVGAAPKAPDYDLLIRGGTIYDGSGAPGYIGDVAIKGDRIAFVGRKAPGLPAKVIDAKGMAVSPGFINMLSHAASSLIVDGDAQSDIRQGVTLEVMGEGRSEGPLSPAMKQLMLQRQTDLKYPISWSTLGGYLDQLVAGGVSPNVASYVGASTVRVNILGERDVDPDAGQLTQMRALVRDAMREGAMGLSTALIYSPGTFAETPEIVALAEEAARCDGLYISHMRSEGDRLIEAIDELVEIARKTGIRAEIFHFKQLGVPNWGKLDEAIARVEKARAEGLRVTADMYPYSHGGTGLSNSMPPWAQDGGLEAFLQRLKDPAIRARIKAEMNKPATDWENLYVGAGGADGMILIGFRTAALKPLAGKTLTEIARMRGKGPEETAMDLMIEDGSRIETLYRITSEDNAKRIAALPWVSFGSDAGAPSIGGAFSKYFTHPRAYGTYARILGSYVRDQNVLTLPQAIHKMSALPARNLRIRDRGVLKAGYFADVVVFDPARVIDRATYAEPHAYAEGMREVIVNGTRVLSGGEHTGARPGRVVRGPGWTGWADGGACKAPGRG